MATLRGLRQLALGAAVVGVAVPRLRRRLGISPIAASALAWQAPFALAVARPRSPARDAALYALQMFAYLTHYELPADDVESLRGRLHVRYPIRADRVLGLGRLPTVRLQRALGRPGRVLPQDIALACVHWAWYFVPHGTVVYILVRHRDHFPRSACLTAAVFDLGLIVYWAVPTAPPWWAAQEDYTEPIRRIMVESGERVWGRLWRPLYDSLAGNPFAAMPSLHFATSVMAARLLSDVGRGPGALGWGYASALGFGLVYLGEHYVVDLVAGLALAEGVRRLSPLAEPAVRAVARTVQALEPRVGT